MTGSLQKVIYYRKLKRETVVFKAIPKPAVNV